MVDLLEVIKSLQNRIEVLERNSLTGSPSKEISVNTSSVSYTYRQATTPLGLNKSTDVGSVWLNTSTGALQWWDGYAWWNGDYPYNNYSDIRVLAPGMAARAEARGYIVLWSSGTAPTADGWYDIWYDTSAGQYKQWQGASWTTITDTKLITALGALTFPSRIYINASPPGGASIGYYWFDTDDGFRFYRWNGVAWETVNTTPNFIVPTTDGIAPSYSPTPSITGLIKSLIVMWSKVANVDAVTYEVHISTTAGFTPSSTTFSQQTVGTMALISTLADGTPLVEGTTYYVKLVAKDTDGAASASAQASGSLGLVGTNQVDSITADKIIAGNLLAVIALIGTLNIGSNISISPGQGILITLSSGGIIQFPSNGSEATIQAKLRTSDVVISGGLSINGTTNTLAGTMTLAKGVSAPKTAVTAVNVLGKPITIAGVETATSNNMGLTDSADGASWLVLGKNVSSSTTAKIKKYNKTTGALTAGTDYNFGSAGQAISGLTRLGNTVYVLHANVQNWMGVYISKFTESTLAYVNDGALDKDGIGTKLTIGGGMAIGNDGTNVYVLWNDSFGNFKLYKYDASTLAFVSVTTITGLSSSYSSYSNMYFGNADIGSGTGRFWFAANVSGVRKIVAINSNAYDATNTFNANAAASGCFYDGTRFYSQSLDADGKVNQYSNIKTDTNTYAGWTLYDATGTTHETPISTVIANLTIQKRSWLYLTAPATFTGAAEMPDSVRFYCGTTGPANAQLWKQTDPGLGVTSTYYESLTLSGSNAPLTNNFDGLPGNAPGDIRSEGTDGTNPYIQLKGDGSGIAGPHKWNSSGKGLSCVTYTGAPTMTSGSTYKAIALATLDTNSTTGITYTTGNFVVSEPGFYQVMAWISYSANATGNRRVMLEWATDTGVAFLSGTKFSEFGKPSENSGTTDILIVGGVWLEANQCIRIGGWQNSGATLTVTGRINIMKVK